MTALFQLPIILWLALSSTQIPVHPELRTLYWHQTNFAVMKIPQDGRYGLLSCYTTVKKKRKITGETCKEAKERLKGIIALPAGYYNPKTLLPADFFRRNGKTYYDGTTNRLMLVIFPDGKTFLTRDKELVKIYPEATFISLGAELAPELKSDGFSYYFIHARVHRAAIGFDKDGNIYLVRTKTSLVKLSVFMKEVLKCQEAANLDGGHTVHGRTPMHIIVRKIEPCPRP